MGYEVKCVFAALINNLAKKYSSIMHLEFIAAKAVPGDLAGIATVFEENRQDWSLLPRTAASIRQDLDQFVVVRTKAGEVVGCAALHLDSPGTAEVLSVAVRPAWQGMGAGEVLMTAVEDLARAHGIDRLWLATLKPQYFARFGYRRFSKWKLPSRILLRKLGLIFGLPRSMWLRELHAPFTFMEKGVK